LAMRPLGFSRPTRCPSHPVRHNMTKKMQGRKKQLTNDLCVLRILATLKVFMTLKQYNLVL
jgi:hypothetical protein